MACINWLHLTDLHMGMSGQTSHLANFRPNFFDDLVGLSSKWGPWDLVLFTGDLTQSGKREEFSKLDEFLDDLWDCFENRCGGCAPELLAVPGNHDVDRNKAHEDIKENIVDLLWEWSITTQEDFWKDDQSVVNTRRGVNQAFANYCEWWNGQKHRPKKGIKNGILPGDFSYTYEKDSVQLGILGLNSGFIQLGSRNYERRLALSSHQFHKACDTPTQGGRSWAQKHHTCLLMTHHPPTWLNELSQRELTNNILGEEFAVHLYGHMHEPKFTSVAAGGSRAQNMFHGRSLFGEEQYEEYGDNGRSVSRKISRLHGYSVGKIEFAQENKLIFFPRALSLEHRNKLIPDYKYFDLDEDTSALYQNFTSLRDPNPNPTTLPEPITLGEHRELIENYRTSLRELKDQYRKMVDWKGLHNSWQRVCDRLYVVQNEMKKEQEGNKSLSEEFKFLSINWKTDICGLLIKLIEEIDVEEKAQEVFRDPDTLNKVKNVRLFNDVKTTKERLAEIIDRILGKINRIDKRFNNIDYIQQNIDKYKQAIEESLGENENDRQEVLKSLRGEILDLLREVNGFLSFIDSTLQNGIKNFENILERSNTNNT